MIIMKMRNNSILIRLGSFSQPTQQSLMRAVSDDHNMNMIKDLNLYHFQPGEESRTIRILIISALWHISTALANLLTGYILQVAFAVKFNPWSWCLILIPFQYSKPLGMIFFIFDPNTLRQYTKLLGVMAVSASCCLMALLYVIFFMTQVSSLAVFVNAWNEGVNPTSLILYLIDMHPDTYK